MAVPTSNLSISDLHTEVGGGSTSQASLDDGDIRAFGNAYAQAQYNVGTAGVPLTSGTEIALGEFRGAAAPTVTTAFDGTYTHMYRTYAGGTYTPATVEDAMTTMSVQTFTGNLMGVNATHTIMAFENGGLSGQTPAGIYAGQITLAIQNNIISTNPAGSYTNTGWSHIQFGYYGAPSSSTYSHTLYRTNAASFFVSPYSQYHYVSYTWGNGSPNYTYNYNTYFGAKNHYTNYGASRTYHSSTQVFRMVL